MNGRIGRFVTAADGLWALASDSPLLQESADVVKSYML